MTDMDSEKQQKIICHCAGTTQAEIYSLIENGFDDLDKLSRMTGACSGCGGCETSVLELLSEVKDSP